MRDTQALATIGEVSEFTRLPAATLRWQRHHGSGIGALAIKVGKHLRWRWADIEKYLDEQAAAAAGQRVSA